MSLLPPAACAAPGESKLQQVQRLVDVLATDADDRALLPAQRAATLEQLKVFGRDPNGSDPIFTREGLDTLCRHGFHRDDEPSAREALRCLANALLVVPRTRQLFVDLGAAPKAAAAYASDAPDDEFLLAYILFLITYQTSVDLNALLAEQDLDESLNKAVKRHADMFEDGKPAPQRTPMQDQALGKTLVLLFNVTHFLKDRANLFSSSIPHLCKLLRLYPLPNPPLQPPTTGVINALLNLDLAGNADVIFPASSPATNVTPLFQVLDRSLDKKFTRVEPNGYFDENGLPLITLLRKLYEIAPAGTKTAMQERLLPSEQDRDQPLGRGASLASRLLQLSTSASAPNTREHTMQLLFELSGSSADTFVRNIGYGYASGFLMTRNIPFTPQNGSASSSSAAPVNPVTGQRLDSEPSTRDPFEGMSEADKEREAERLFVLFERHAPSPTPSDRSRWSSVWGEKNGAKGKRKSTRGKVKQAWANLWKRSRLKRTGIIDVQNPVELAQQQGRFEEVEEDKEVD